jgi:catechol 2,3-dioxygenase-like lactoylglutathione lyase family enzyme
VTSPKGFPGSGVCATTYRCPRSARTERQNGIDHFGFRLSDKTSLDAAIDEVERSGGRIIDRGEDALGRPYAYVTHPDGYMIEL